jgi:hypothetical protein
MNKFAKQRKAYNQAIDEIRKELIEEIRNALYQMSKYKKNEGKKISFNSGMGTFFFSVEKEGASYGWEHANPFNLMGRLSKIVEEFGYFGRGRSSSIEFFNCQAIPDGDMWCIGEAGGAKRIEGKLV